MWSKREWAKTPRNETIPSWSTCSDVFGNQCICQRPCHCGFHDSRSWDKQILCFLMLDGPQCRPHFCREVGQWHCHNNNNNNLPFSSQILTTAGCQHLVPSGVEAVVLQTQFLEHCVPSQCRSHHLFTPGGQGARAGWLFFDWKKCFANPLTVVTVVSSFIQICPCTARIPGFGLLSFEVWGASVEFWP